MSLPLPDELIGLTFDHLDVPSLLRCMLVCKLFHAVILGSTPLLYKIELFASYMEDNEHASVDTVTRLHLLRKYNYAWNNLQWSTSGTIPMLDGHCWELSGGVLAQWTQENALALVQLPCLLKGIPEKRWSVPFDFRARDFGLDNSQDLIVLLELTGTPPNMSCKIHLRTFSGEHHPLAATKQIVHAPAKLHAECTFLIQVCGKHIGILFEDQLGDSTANSFLVWDWRTGDRLLDIHVSQFRSFAFMTEDLILAAILRSDSQPTLQVLRVAPLAYSIHSVDDIPYLCELHYPMSRGTIDYFLIRAEPTPTWRPPVRLDVPFYGSRKDFIFTISLRVFWGDAHGSTVLLVPLSTLLPEVEKSKDVPGRNVPWDAWGADGTRMFRREPSEVWVCYTYGMKFIHGLRWKGGHEARVYDFNPYAVKRHVKKSVESPTPWKRLASESTPSAYNQTFCKPVTRLPGRVANVTFERTDEGWDACMIGEDHIVMVQPRTSTYGYLAM